jgi:5-methylcytosine-specific restriction endonuclease McrA
MSSPRGRQGYVKHATVEEAAGVMHSAGMAAALPQGVMGGMAALSGVVSALDYKVLVLNKAFVAVRVISAKRAFSMLSREIAEVIHVENGRYVNYDFATWAELSQLQKSFEPDKHDWVRTVRFDIAVPRIIRLLGYDRLPVQIVKLNRRNLFARDRNQCQYCGRHFPTNELSIDHVLPRAQGGGDSWENLVCACIKCNARKGGRTPEQAGMNMTRKPVRPKRNPLISIRLGQDRYATWKAFLDDAYWNVELK